MIDEAVWRRLTFLSRFRYTTFVGLQKISVRVQHHRWFTNIIFMTSPV